MIKFIILLLCFIASPVLAQQIVSYSVDASIEEMTLYESISITFLNTYSKDLTEFTYPFPGSLIGLSVYDARGDMLNFSSAYRGGNTYVTVFFSKPLPIAENFTIIYKFTREGAITRKENTYILTESYSLLASVVNFDMTLTLPEGFGLVEASPGPTKIVSDGRRHILSWDLREPIPTFYRGFKVIVLYERLFLPWWVGKEKYIYGLVALIVLTGGAVSLYTRIKERRRGAKSKIDILKEDEQKIMNLIIEEDGIDQRDIQKKTGFSKAKVSKILSELEKRGVIRKEPHGRRNKIYLTEKIKET